MRKLTAITIALAGLTSVALPQDTGLRKMITPDIEIIQVSDHAYVHVSYTQTAQWGRIASNGVIYAVNGEVLLFDTPMTDSLTKDLVHWITDSLKAQIVGFVPNHWHDDCMGGLSYLHSIGIPSYANEMTREIAKAKGLPVPQTGFVDSLTLHLSDQAVLCKYYGPGHAFDNIIVWIPSERILFAGCMVKEMRSQNLGNTADADLAGWPKTISRVMAAYLGVRIVVPGHGQFGGIELLQHTFELLTKDE
jgi:metallo-beta-lactamase class B